MKAWRNIPLYMKIFILLVLGAIIGFFLGDKVTMFKAFGDGYILLLKMLVVPLVFFSIISGVTKLASPKEFGRMGSRVILYYLITSTMAAAFGVLLATLIRPGMNAEGMLGIATEVKYTEYSVATTVLSWIPQNVVQSMANMDMIPVIIFAILFGVCLIMVGEKGQPVVAFVNGANEAMLQMTNLITELAPYGIFFLTMQLTGNLGSKMLTVAAKFVLADYVGLLALLLIGYPILLKFVGHISPVKFYKNIYPAMLIAASTTSSNATLPMSFKCSGDRCGVPEKLYGFSLPLGATINMDGFSVALGIIAVTALDLYNIPLTPMMIIQAVGMGLILSIGAPGVKGTAVVMSAVLFEALGLPMGMLPLIAAIWPVVDIGHTTINVTGDQVGTCVVASKLNMMDKEIFNSDKKSLSGEL